MRLSTTKNDREKSRVMWLIYGWRKKKKKLIAASFYTLLRAILIDSAGIYLIFIFGHGNNRDTLIVISAQRHSSSDEKRNY